MDKIKQTGNYKINFYRKTMGKFKDKSVAIKICNFFNHKDPHLLLIK